jgi:hypothetical protein
MTINIYPAEVLPFVYEVQFKKSVIDKTAKRYESRAMSRDKVKQSLLGVEKRSNEKQMALE